MDTIFVISIFLNMVLFIFFLGEEKPVLESDQARLAVHQELKSVIDVADDAKVAFANTCAEHQSGQARVTGLIHRNRDKEIAGNVAGLEQTEMSYEARVEAHCSPLNLNCYEVDRLEVHGKTTITPKI